MSMIEPEKPQLKVVNGGRDSSDPIDLLNRIGNKLDLDSPHTSQAGVFLRALEAIKEGSNEAA